jgi:N-acetylglucosaminyldiphosphoundecaprenol N-acetyl-beta-D-mannosaminyltransferase
MRAALASVGGLSQDGSMSERTPTGSPPTFSLLGVEYQCADVAGAVDWLIDASLAGAIGHVCVGNVHTATHALLAPSFRRAQRRSLKVFPDGMPVVWAGRLLGHPARRVYGAELMWSAMDRGRTRGVRHFLLGGTEELLVRLRARIERDLPGTAVVGACAPPFLSPDDPEWGAVFEAVERAGPHLTWVGLGAPKQELLMDRHGAHARGILLGVGQAFALNAGLAPSVPRSLQALGLEWLCRLALEPRRLWWRYLFYNPLFVALAGAQILQSRIARLSSCVL